MSLWDGKQAKAASKYSIYGTALGGLAKVASAGVDLHKSLDAKPPKAILVDE